MMYPTVDVQIALTFARLHQDDVHGSFPRRRRGGSWLLRRTEMSGGATAQTITTPARTPHQTAAA
jgi:hypothetical protein